MNRVQKFSSMVMLALVSAFFLVFSSALASENPENSLQLEKNQKILLSDEGKDFFVSGGYDAVGVHFLSKSQKILVSADSGKTWTEMTHSLDQANISNPEEFSKLIFLPEISEKFRFKISQKGTQNSQKFLEFFFVNTQVEEDIVASSNYQMPQAPYARDDNFFLENGIISRQIWGADESLRYRSGYVKPSPVVNNPPTQQTVRCQQLQTLYPEEFKAARYVATENNKKLKWGYRYSPFIKKIVVHHTAENGALSGKRTTEQVMRGIYSYHALGRGWGDVGYNFVVAPDGKIFEGRAGGDYVVGGHVYCANVQTLGISLMGNFQDSQPTEEQLEALQKLLRGLAKKYNVDPSAESMFHGKFTGNVVGHRDYGQTACPGKNLYSLIPFIRDGVDLSGLAFQAQKLMKRSGEFLAQFIPIQTLSSGNSAHYILQFKNTGQGTWNNQTWLFADLPNTDVSVLPVDGKSIFYSAKLRENSVPPNGVGTFEVDIIAGFQDGLQTVEFTPVVDSRRLPVSAVIPVEVKNAKISTKLQKFETTVSKDKKYVWANVDVKNTGNSVFLRDEILLKIRLENSVRFLKMKEKKVGKNGVAHFSGKVPVVGPKNAKLFSMVLANRNGNISGAKIDSRVIVIDPSKSSSSPALKKKKWEAEVIGMQFKKFKTSEKTGNLPQKYFSIKNTGETTWTKKNSYLQALRRGERHIMRMQENAVKPGQTATFYLKGKTRFSSHQVFRLEMRYKNEKYRLFRMRGGKFRWIVLPASYSSEISQPAPAQQNPEISQPEISGKNELASQKDIRIKLGYDKDSVTFLGNFNVEVDGKMVSIAQNLLSFHQSGNAIASGLHTGKIFRIVPQNGEITTVLSWNRPTAWDASLNDNQFRGVIEARVYNGKMVLINELPLEDYLKGLAEVSDSAPVEKQKTLAVIARSYAQFYMSPQHRKYPNAPFDGDDSPASFQKYLGYGYEKRSPHFSQAVKNTQGVIVRYHGKLVKTPFFSESAGRTLSAQEVWGWTHTPYLVSVDDHFCKNGRGTKKGHGVGLSGCGAEEMARQGKKFPEILKYYYKGVSVGK